MGEQARFLQDIDRDRAEHQRSMDREMKENDKAFANVLSQADKTYAEHAALIRNSVLKDQRDYFSQMTQKLASSETALHDNYCTRLQDVSAHLANLRQVGHDAQASGSTYPRDISRDRGYNSIGRMRSH